MITELTRIITAPHTSLITLLSQLSLVIRAISTRWASANITLAPRANTGATAGQWRPRPRVAPAPQRTGAMFTVQTPAAIHDNMELDM